MSTDNAEDCTALSVQVSQGGRDGKGQFRCSRYGAGVLLDGFRICEGLSRLVPRERTILHRLGPVFATGEMIG